MYTIGFVCYDDGCHLKRYACNPTRGTCTPTAERLSSLNIVVDKMHFKGHTDKWCMENCNPYAHEELNQVESMWTSVCQNVEIHISASWGEGG